MQPGGASAAEYGYHSGDGEGVTDRPMTRANMLAGVPAGPWLEWRRPKRRKTSEIVTMIEMMMRTMMIQVWSGMRLVGRLGSEKKVKTYGKCDCQQSSRIRSLRDRGIRDISR